MQSIPRNNFGGQLGAAFGTGLQELAGLKLAELTKKYDTQQERSQFAKTWEPILGKNSANFLSGLSPEERKNALDDITSLIQLNEPPSSRQQASELGGLSSMQQQGQQQFGPEQLKQAARQQFTNQAMGQQQQPQFEQQQPVSNQQEAQQPQITPEKAKLIQNILMSPREKREREKLDLAKRTANIKETKQYVDELKGKEKASKEANLRLKRMETLIDQGNLPNAAIWSALSKLEHAPFISGLTAPFAELLKGGVKWYSGKPADIEEFEKLSSEFVKNAKQYFGSRITQKEVEMFMQTVPTLMQTDAGKKKLIENIRSLNELTDIEAKAARSIIKENGGIAPIDIEQQVQDKIGNKLDKVAKKFTVR